MGPVNKRSIRNYLILPQYQLRYSLWLSLTGVILAFVICGMSFSYLRGNYAALVELCPMSDGAQRELLNDLRLVAIKLVAAIFAFLLFTYMMGIWLSHRTVGPIYHMRRVIGEIVGGNSAARVRLRPNDDFKELAEDFNTMLDELQKQGK